MQNIVQALLMLESMERRINMDVLNHHILYTNAGSSQICFGILFIFCPPP